MPISENRLKARLEIRKDQVEQRDVMMCKLRNKIQKGYVPTSPKEFASVLQMVSDYQKHVGCMEECQDILKKLVQPVPEVPQPAKAAKEEPMTMEKYGVECQKNHDLNQPYMEKTASGDAVICKHCGARLDLVKVSDEVNMTAKTGSEKPKVAEGNKEALRKELQDKKDKSIDKMFGG